MSDRFGRLTVVRYFRGEDGRSRAECACDCGGTSTPTVSNLERGISTSCGCKHVEQGSRMNRKHGHAGRKGGRAPEYEIWVAMKSRCYDVNHIAYPLYGGRGITVCKRWMEGEHGLHPYECFLADMGPRPSKRHSIDRQRNAQGYFPGNCVWSPPKVQARNTRRSVIPKEHSSQECFQDLVDRYGVVSYHTALKRVRRGGWPVEKAVSTPVLTTWSRRP